jgi:transcriptional/translational regulatory protein YebC/TACO1
MELALEAGAEDVTELEDRFEITCAPSDFVGVVEQIESAGIEIDVKQVGRIPSNSVDVDDDTAKTVMKLIEQLEDHDDVQSVATNVTLSTTQLEELTK